MNQHKIKWWKAILMLVLTMFFLFLSIEETSLLRYDYSDWIVSKWNVQERAYEALSMLFATGMLFVMTASAFIVSLRSLIHCFFPLKKPSMFARLAIRHGGYPALIALILFLILLAGELVLRNVIANTPEVSEAPATLLERKISGWNSIAMLLVLETAIVMFVSWLQTKSGKNENISQKG